MSQRWVPLMGDFDTATADTIVFRGRPMQYGAPDQPQPEEPQGAMAGILLSDIRMVDGTLKATMEFAAITNHSVCEFILGYDAKSRAMITRASAALCGCSAFGNGFRPKRPAPRAETCGRTMLSWETAQTYDLTLGIRLKCASMDRSLL